MQVDVEQRVEILSEMPSHSVERELIYEAIVGDEADDAVAPFQAVSRPPKEPNVGVVKLFPKGRLRVLHIRLSDAAIDSRVFAVPPYNTGQKHENDDNRNSPKRW